MLLTRNPYTHGLPCSSFSTTNVGPSPQRSEPSLVLVVVGICAIGPTPQIVPSAFDGEKKAENCVPPMPSVLPSPGASPGCQMTGTIVRVIRFQSLFNSNGTTGWILRILWVSFCGP